MKNGSLVLSLDFELIWGVFDGIPSNFSTSYFSNTREVIPEMLNLFEGHKIHATWATVGMLFNRNWEDWFQNKPTLLPQYVNKKLSAYEFAAKDLKKLPETIFFAPSLIKLIGSTTGQEVASHTYSHYYCLEKGQRLEEFEADLKMALRLAKSFNIDLKSLIFPRNQMNSNYLEICWNLGIENVRSNPEDWYWKDPTSNSFHVKIARSGDAYFNFGKKSYSGNNLKLIAGLPLEQPASRFLRPVEGQKILRQLKLKRIKEEMTYAARKNEVYHLWWHPHNFGDLPEQSLNDLKELVNHFENLQKEFDFQSWNMAELGKKIQIENRKIQS
ncbi:polysaccharide deacetylase family protein [Salinimicrobium sp. TIG7-5_MAKvit]|uniref:polysaccharide deacetylase family protein n=1 Tax=Salinimicrobium sp. TIG7-5_MAKvit TaxID=3121289 RepID=UPI003C6E6850